MAVKKCLIYPSSVLILLAQLSLAAAVLATPAQAQTPVGYWKFDDGSGTKAGDSSGSGQMAALANSVGWVTGRIGGAVSANAANRQYVSIPQIDLSGTNAVTVALWSNRAYSTGGGHALFESTTNFNNSTTGFAFLPDDHTCLGIAAALHGNGGSAINCYSQPSSGVWHHLAIVFDKSQTGGNEVAFYIDGKLQAPNRNLAASTNTNNFGNNPLYIFSRGGASYFDSGVVDDFRVYSSVLAAPQIQQLYQYGKSLIGKDFVVSVDGSGTMATKSFSTSTKQELLVAFVSYDGPSNASQTARVSGGGLAWTLVKRSNSQHGTAEIWAATAPVTPFNAIVTSQPGTGSYHGSLTVIGFINASGLGVTGQAAAPTGAPDIKLPGISAGNWVFAVGNDWDRAIVRTPVTGQVLVHQRVDTQVGDTCWVQSTAAPSTTSGSVDIHDNAPTTDRWNYAAVAIVAQEVKAYSISGTLSGVGGPGARVNLTGTVTAATTADAGGNYNFTGLVNGSYTVTPSKTGYVYTPASKAVAVNGANVTGVNFGSTAAQTYSISGAISGVGGPGARVNLTGTVTAATTADAGGNYRFTGLANGSYTATPSKTGFVYSPASRAVTVNGANVGAVNFSSTAPSHWVDLSWTGSKSQVVGYNAYRSNTSHGPYNKLNTTLITTTNYTDQAVQSRSTYYYVTTAVDKNGNESVYSSQAVATIP